MSRFFLWIIFVSVFLNLSPIYALKEWKGFVEKVRNETINALNFWAPDGKKVVVPARQTVKVGEIEIPSKKLTDKDIKVAGIAYQEISDFSSDYYLKMDASNFRGYAWIKEALAEKGRFTLFFQSRSRKEKEGNICVVLSDRSAPYCKWRLVFGANHNQETILYKIENNKANIMLRVSKNQNPLAVVKPGVVSSFWVSVNNNLIIFGQGKIGTGIIGCWYDTSGDLQKVDRVGFSSGPNAVDYAGTILTKPLIVNKKWDPSFSSSDFIDGVAAADGYTILTPRFRVAGEGALVGNFISDGKELRVAFGDNREYEIVFNGRNFAFYREGVEVRRLRMPSNIAPFIQKGKSRKFWISLGKGFIFVGLGELGQNLIFAWQDFNFLSFSNVIQVRGGKVKGLQLGLPTNFILDFGEKQYKREADLYNFPRELALWIPYAFSLFKTKKDIRIQNLMLKTSPRIIQSIGANVKGKYYYFMFVVRKDGVPKLVKTRGEELSEARYKLEKTIFTKLKQAESGKEFAKGLMQAAGMGMGGILVGMAGGLAGVIGGMASKKAASAKEEIGSERFSEREYSFIEGVSSSFKQSAALSPAIKGKVEAVRRSVEASNDEDDEDVLVTRYLNIITDIVHPSVVKDPYIKKQIVLNLYYLYLKAFYKTNLDEKYLYKLLGVLTAAINNPYLINLENPKEKGFKKQWYLWANTIAETLIDLLNNKKSGVCISSLYGNYYWYSLNVYPPCSISFEAKAAHDIFVALSPKKDMLRNSNISFYEIVIRGFKGTKSVLRVSSLGKAVAEHKYQEIIDLYEEKKKEGLEYALDVGKRREMQKMLALRFRRYIINMPEDGHIMVLESEGKDKPYQVILDWKDPRPLKVKYFGLGSWNVNVYYRNIRIKKALSKEEISKISYHMKEPSQPVEISL